MSLNFIILAIEVGNVGILKKYKSDLMSSISHIGGEFISAIMIKNDKEETKEYLIRTSDKIDNNVIIVIGDTTVASICDTAHEAIKEVIDNDISDELNALISDLNKKLIISFHRAICGIRKQTLIINMCGSCINAMTYLKTNGDVILQIMCLISKQDEEMICNNNSNNESSYILEKAKKNQTTIYKKQKPIVMTTVESAIDIMRNVIQESKEEVRTEIINTEDAYRRILAECVYSCVNVPCCRTSTKHGYAVLASDGQGIRKVLTSHSKLCNDIFIVSGTCMRVRSGAPIPDGATAVVALENTKVTTEYDNDDSDYFNVDDKEYEIDVLIAPEKNENIRNIGYHLKCEQYVIEKFIRIGPAELGILALCGLKKVLVVKVPSVGLLSIGDELDELENPLIGQTYDCNRITLISLLKENGFDPVDLGITAHQSIAIVNKIVDALEKVDVLVTMGFSNDKDILKPILQKYFNATIHFGRVCMKPGKSTMFATCMINNRKKYLLGMSANPATVPIVAHVLLLPFLNEMHCNYHAESIKMQTCINSQHELHSRPKFSWATLEWTSAETFPRTYCSNQRQNVMSYRKANALLMLPSSTPQVPTLNAAFIQAIFTDLKCSHHKNIF